MTMGMKLFVGFDGTVTLGDLGNDFFRKFGGPVCATLVGDYRSGVISAQQCFRREVAAIGRLPVPEAAHFVRGRAIDPGFKEFVGFCLENGLECQIVSDGLDFYIKQVLEANGLDRVPFAANTVQFSDVSPDGNATITMAFPYGDAECDRCACCKRNIMLTRSGEQDCIVYIGDGFSDQCAVQYADVVFAKDGLQSYCQRENISHYTYGSFFDVVVRLRTLVGRQNQRKRRRAELHRQAAFQSEW